MIQNKSLTKEVRTSIFTARAKLTDKHIINKAGICSRTYYDILYYNHIPEPSVLTALTKAIVYNVRT